MLLAQAPETPGRGLKRGGAVEMHGDLEHRGRRRVAVLEQQQLRLAKPGGQVRCRASRRLSDLNLLALCRLEG